MVVRCLIFTRGLIWCTLSFFHTLVYSISFNCKIYLRIQNFKVLKLLFLLPLVSGFWAFYLVYYIGMVGSLWSPWVVSFQYLTCGRPWKRTPIFHMLTIKFTIVYMIFYFLGSIINYLKDNHIQSIWWNFNVVDPLFLSGESTFNNKNLKFCHFCCLAT